MNSLFTKNKISSKDILSIIENETEESIHLDFKEAMALGKSEGKKKEISKDVSSFANSDGGIIIYGVKEENHKAVSLSFIDGNEFTKEWLEQVISSTIQRHIPDLEIIPIRFENNILKSIYVVKIPKSVEAPHISKDKRFYKRFNFQSVFMEEYEIRQLYGRKVKSKLEIGDVVLRTVNEEDDDDFYNLQFEASIVNDGDIPESSYKINIYLNNFNEHLKIGWDKTYLKYDYTTYPNQRIKISAGSQVPIYPTEKVNAIRFVIVFNKKHINEALNELNYEILLFYPNGEDRLESDFKSVTKKILEKETSK